MIYLSHFGRIWWFIFTSRSASNAAGWFVILRHILSILPTPHNLLSKSVWKHYWSCIFLDYLLSLIPDPFLSHANVRTYHVTFFNQSVIYIMSLYRKIWVISGGRLPLNWFFEQAYSLISSVCIFYTANNDSFRQGCLISGS